MKRATLCLIAWAIVSTAMAQKDSIRNLVFEGAGIRGIAYSGAILELEKKNVLAGVKRVGGTSSGSVTATLLSLGYTANEIASIVKSTPYKKFNDGRFFFIGGVNRLDKYYGWYRGKQFDKWLSKLIAAKAGDEHITFLQLKEKGFKDLYITGTCLNKQTVIVFSAENYPNMKVKDAVRISISIPLYFEAIYIDSKGKIIHHPKNKEGLDIMVDGGFTANFPIKIFDSTRFFDPPLLNSFATNPQTIGFRIDRSEQILYDQEGKGLAPREIRSLNEYLGAFYNIMIENLNRQLLTKDDWQRTVSISDGNISPRVRKLSSEEVGVLIYNGEAATKRFFSK